jgi:hypothetical protein
MKCFNLILIFIFSLLISSINSEEEGIDKENLIEYVTLVIQSDMVHKFSKSLKIIGPFLGPIGTALSIVTVMVSDAEQEARFKEINDKLDKIGVKLNSISLQVKFQNNPGENNSN